jgi:hypothetical protein
MTMAEHEKEKYFFFVGNDKYDTDMKIVTGAYIKSRVPNFPLGAGLQLDGEGNNPDRMIRDDEEVSLEIGHGHGPKHFTIVPPANFG